MPTFGTVDTQTELTGGGTLIINAARPPTDTDGVVGDYWLDTAGKTLYGPKGAGGYGPDQVVVSNTPTSSAPAGGTTYGARLRTLVLGRITALRYYRVSGQAVNTVTIVLYQASTQTELGRVTVGNAASAPAGWVSGTLTTPVVTSVNQDLRVGYSISPTTVSLGYQGAFTPVSAIPTLVTFQGNCSGQGTPIYPGTDQTVCYFADVVFQALLPTWPIAIKSAP